MKKIRKVIGTIMSILMVWTLTVSLAAQEAFTITLTEAKANETYRIYKMLDASVNADRTSYSYTAAEEWKAFFAEDGDGYAYVTVSGIYISPKDGADMAAFGKAAKAYAENRSCTEAADSITPDTKQSITFELTDPGYYLMTSTAGTLTMVTTTPQSNSVTVTEKTEDGLMDMTISDKTAVNNTNTLDIGKTNDYVNTVTVGKGAKNYVVHVDLSEGLTLNGVSSITVDGTEMSSEYYTIETSVSDGCELHIIFHQDWLNQVTSTAEVKITYQAELNENAAIAPETNTNTTWLTFGDNSTTAKIIAETSTYFMDLIKVDGSTNRVLEGAEFEMYSSKDKEYIKVPLVQIGDGEYRIASQDERNAEGFESAVIEAGKVRIYGINGSQTKFLEEIKAPDGYNRLTSKTQVTPNNANLETKMTGNTWNLTKGGVGVVNSKGAILPETGGSGNMYFYMFGGALLILGGTIMIRFSLAGRE